MPMRCSRLARMTARAALVALALVLPVVPAAAQEKLEPPHVSVATAGRGHHPG